MEKDVIHITVQKEVNTAENNFTSTLHFKSIFNL